MLKLDFERLCAIQDTAKIPQVLHGSSSISGTDFHKVILLEITKTNFFTRMSEVALHTSTEHINTARTQYNDYPMMIKQIKESVATVVAE